MEDGLIEVLAAGICAFSVGIDRDGDGHGHVAKRPPQQPCQGKCDYCLAKAEYLAMIAMEYIGVINDDKQPA